MGDNVKMYRKAIGLGEDEGWMYLAQDRDKWRTASQLSATCPCNLDAQSKYEQNFFFFFCQAE